MDVSVILLLLEADLTVDGHAHPVCSNLPDDLVPVAGADEALAFDAVLLCGGRIVDTQLTN